MDGVELVVLHHFGGYVRGDVIADPAKIAEVLSGPHEYCVIKRMAPDYVPGSNDGHGQLPIASYKIG